MSGRSDKIGNEVAAAVLAAAERGVKVRIIKDIGAFRFERIEMNRKSLFNLRLPAPQATGLQADHAPRSRRPSSVMNIPTLSVWRCSLIPTSPWTGSTRPTPNITSSDERLLVTGSINIEDRHFDYYDYMLALDDPEIVSRYRQRAAGAVPFDSSRAIDFLCNSHRSEASDFEIKPEILRLIDGARHSIYVEMAYLGDEEVTAAFIAAAKRGVQVTFLFSREANIGNDLNYRTIHEIFTGAEVSVHLTDTMIHSKLMMVDEEVILTGSANLSVFFHAEIGGVGSRHPERTFTGRSPEVSH